jgi:hypothetical protein
MPENAKVRRISLVRKICTIVFLPIIICVWMIGWVLLQMGSPMKPLDMNQKTLQTHSRFESVEKKSRPSETETEEIRSSIEPIIA